MAPDDTVNMVTSKYNKTDENNPDRVLVSYEEQEF